MTVQFSSNLSSGYVPVTVQFYDRTDGYPTQWNWDFGDGTSSSLRNPTHAYSTPGRYTVTLTANGQTCTKTNFIIASESIDANFRCTPTSGDAPLTVSFADASTGNPTTWQWAFGDGGSARTSAASHTYIYPGKYPVSLFVSNDSGGIGSKVVQECIIVTAPKKEEDIRACKLKAAFTWIPHDGKSPSAPTFFDESKGNPTRWHWDFGDGITSSLRNPIHIFRDPGTYNVTLQIWNEIPHCTHKITNVVPVLMATPHPDYQECEDKEVQPASHIRETPYTIDSRSSSVPSEPQSNYANISDVYGGAPPDELQGGCCGKVLKRGTYPDDEYKWIKEREDLDADGGGWEITKSKTYGETGFVQNTKSIFMRHTGTGSVITIMRDGNVIIHADKGVKIVSQESINLKGKKDVVIEALENITLKAGKVITTCSHERTIFQAQEDIIIKGMNIYNRANKFNVASKRTVMLNEELFNLRSMNIKIQSSDYINKSETAWIEAYKGRGALKCRNIDITGPNYVIHNFPHIRCPDYVPGSPLWLTDAETDMLLTGLNQKPECAQIFGEKKPDLDESSSCIEITCHGKGQCNPSINGQKLSSVSNCKEGDTNHTSYIYPSNYPINHQLDREDVTTLSLVPCNDCHELESLIVNGGEHTPIQNNTATITDMRGDMNIIAVFKKKRIIIRVHEVENGTITPTGDNQIECQKEFVCTVKPKPNHKVKSIYVNQKRYPSPIKPVTIINYPIDDPTDDPITPIIPPIPRNLPDPVPPSPIYVPPPYTPPYRPDPDMPPYVLPDPIDIDPIVPVPPPITIPITLPDPVPTPDDDPHRVPNDGPIILPGPLPKIYPDPIHTPPSPVYPTPKPVIEQEIIERCDNQTTTYTIEEFVNSTSSVTGIYGSIQIVLRNVTDCISIRVVIEPEEEEDPTPYVYPLPPLPQLPPATQKDPVSWRRDTVCE